MLFVFLEMSDVETFFAQFYLERVAVQTQFKEKYAVR